jgi:hypothetical protein
MRKNNVRAAAVTGGALAALVIGAGVAKAVPVDYAEICRIYHSSSITLGEAYGISPEEATVQMIAGWYEVSKTKAQTMFDAADCS